MVPYRRPRRNANSATLSSGGVTVGGSGSARTKRNSVVRLLEFLLASAESTSRPSSQRQSNELEIGAQSSRASTVTFNQHGHLLDKCVALASRFVAAKTTHVQMDDNLPIGYWHVRDAARVAAMECLRPDGTVGHGLASCLARGGCLIHPG